MARSQDEEMKTDRNANPYPGGKQREVNKCMNAATPVKVPNHMYTRTKHVTERDAGIIPTEDVRGRVGFRTLAVPPVA
jgi:hypothetical protein